MSSNDYISQEPFVESSINMAFNNENNLIELDEFKLYDIPDIIDLDFKNSVRSTHSPKYVDYGDAEHYFGDILTTVVIPTDGQGHYGKPGIMTSQSVSVENETYSYKYAAFIDYFSDGTHYNDVMKAFQEAYSTPGGIVDRNGLSVSGKDEILDAIFNEWDFCKSVYREPINGVDDYNKSFESEYNL